MFASFFTKNSLVITEEVSMILFFVSFYFFMDFFVLTIGIFACFVILPVVQLPAQLWHHNFCSEYIPFPAKNNPNAKPAKMRSISIIWNDRPLVCMAPIIMIKTITLATRVNIPNMKSDPARISPATITANQAFIDKNVSPRAWIAPPINHAICSPAPTFIIPWYKKIQPIVKRRINKPTDFLHIQDCIMFSSKNKNTSLP